MHYDDMVEINQSIGPSEFNAVLNYYGLRVQKNSFLCPFHNDTHTGSCFINRNRKSAHCFACGKSFDAVDLVEYFEGLPFKEALQFLWTTILGNTLPEHPDKPEKPKFPVKFKDLEFLGIEHPSDKVPCIIAERYYFKVKDKVEAPYSINKDEQDEDGFCPVYEDKPYQSLYKMYDSDPDTVLWLLYNKSEEAVSRCYERLNWTKRKADELKRESGNDPETVQICREAVDSAGKELAHAKFLRNDLWKQINQIRNMQKRAS